jgi:hypothetical protein
MLSFAPGGRYNSLVISGLHGSYPLSWDRDDRQGSGNLKTLEDLLIQEPG